MNDETDNRTDELLALAAFGELTVAEQVELDELLAADAELGDELAADLAIAARLQSTTPIVPPPTVKQSVLASIADVAQDAGNVAPLAPPADPSHEMAPPPPTAPAQTRTPEAPDVVRIDRARSRRWHPIAAAAAVVMLVVGGVIVGTRDSGQSRFDAVEQAADAQRRDLDGDLDGQLAVVWSPSAQSFVLAGTDIPVLADAETYQLWFVDSNGATPIGIFQPDDEGRVEQVYDDLDPTDFVVGVTVEPAGGSESPTLPIVASA